MSKADVARAALRNAENKVGLVLRIGMPLPGTVDAVAAHSPSAEVLPSEPLSSRVLAATLSSYLTPGSRVSIQGSTSALFALAAQAWQPEDWGAILQLPDAGLLAASQEGVPLDRTIIVQELGSSPLRILASLVDSFAVVIAGPVRLSAGDRHRIDARIRKNGTILLTTGSWPGSTLHLKVDHTTYYGLNRGHGVIGGEIFEWHRAQRSEDGTGAVLRNHRVLPAHQSQVAI